MVNLVLEYLFYLLSYVLLILFKCISPLAITIQVNFQVLLLIPP
jgi:hypothetical protein